MSLSFHHMIALICARTSRPIAPPVYRLSNLRVEAEGRAEVRTYRIPISQVYHPEYKTNLMSLKRFVMVRFLRDTTVIPNISSVRVLSPAHELQTTSSNICSMLWILAKTEDNK